MFDNIFTVFVLKPVFNRLYHNCRLQKSGKFSNKSLVDHVTTEWCHWQVGQSCPDLCAVSWI